MATISIEALDSAQIDAAARLLARAFVTNPLHVAAFGAGQFAANEAFFRIGLAAMKGRKLAAMGDARMIGVIHWVPSPACQYSGGEKLQMMPSLLKAFGVRSTLNVMSWLSAWSKIDPAKPRMHLGPIGVNPEMQGRRSVTR